MPAATPDDLHAATALRRSLEEAADAMAHADAERLLGCETQIQAALSHLSTSRLSADARAQLAGEVVQARHALQRCRRLGLALNDFVRLRLTAQGLDDGYGRSGTSVSDALHTIHRTA